MYTGFQTITANDSMLNEYYLNNTLPGQFLENEYIILCNELGTAVEYAQYKNGKLNKVKYPKIESQFSGKTKPRNPEQYLAIDLLKNRDIPVKLITGKFGTGKTLLCATAAIEAIENDKFEKLVFVRNNIQVSDTGDMGALPGDQLEKLLPYVMPLADHCGGISGLEYLMNKGKIEVIPLAYLRGRSIKNAILYSTESENLTIKHIQLLLGRIDQGSELWLDGDPTQADKKIFAVSETLQTVANKFKGNKLFGYVHLIKSERSEVAAMADILDDVRN